MIIFGAVLASFGVGSTILGFYISNSAEARFNEIFGGKTDPGFAWIIAGVIALCAGIVLLIVGFSKIMIPGTEAGKFSDVSGKGTTPGEKLKEFTEKYKCPACGAFISPAASFCGKCGAKRVDVDHCADCGHRLRKSDIFCPRCGTRTRKMKLIGSLTPNIEEIEK